MLNLDRLGKMNDYQLLVGSQIVELIQGIMSELEPLCLRLGTDLTRDELLEIIKVRFVTKIDILKLIPLPKIDEES